MKNELNTCRNAGTAPPQPTRIKSISSRDCSVSLAAPVVAARIGPIEDKMAHALGFSDRVLDRRRPAAGNAE
jgi:hypothetical protein